MFNFGNTWIRSYRDGGWGEVVKLRPGQVSVHDGDVTTNVYDLSGLGKGVGKEFREWAVERRAWDNYSIEIVGDWPRLAVEYRVKS